MASFAEPRKPAMTIDADDHDDPFLSSSPHAHPPSPLNSHPPAQRYSTFDNQVFAPPQPNSTSPGHAKRALEAHLKETDKRIQDASRLGTSLLQQRKELAARLQDVERQKDNSEIGPDLQKKLSELEREYTEVGRESARAFLPKSRLVSNDHGDPTMSPAVLTGDSRASPSKVSAPSRRQRNQPSGRVHDIEFATEISTSLLAQVRQLQAALVDKDDALKAETGERAQLESEVHSFRQRLRVLDDNEQKYKDENWNLETQLQELTAAHKDTTDRGDRLHASLKSTEADKQAVHRELEDLKQSHNRLTEDHALAKRQQDSELHGLRRDITGHENERDGLNRRIDELTAQNTELAKAVAYRWNSGNGQSDRELGSGVDEFAPENISAGDSPPPSPTKGGARAGMLESETLKSSLSHAHRMIQNLKNNIHREKTEKVELKRMLQDARDELEARRGDGPALAKKRRSEQENARSRKVQSGQLGASRSSRQEFLDDPDWEDHDGEDNGVFRSSTTSTGTARGPRAIPMPGAFADTETDTTDAFETANERDNTETEAFQTGNEDVGQSSEGDLTETENAVNRSGTVKPRNVSTISNRPGDRRSFMSTASTSGDEEQDQMRTPVISQQPRYKLKVGRNRRSGRASGTFDSPDSRQNDSPAVSFASSNTSTPLHNGQTLDAELDALSDDEGTVDGTPSKSVYSSRSSPEALRQRPVSTSSAIASKPAMVHSGMMTEPWQPEPTAVEPVPEPVSEPKESRSMLAAATGAVGGAIAGLTGSAFGSGGAAEKSQDRDVADKEVETGPSENTDREIEARPNEDATMSPEPVAAQSAPLQLTDIISQHTAPMSPPRHVESQPIAPQAAIQTPQAAVQTPQPVKPEIATMSPTPKSRSTSAQARPAMSLADMMPRGLDAVEPETRSTQPPPSATVSRGADAFPERRSSRRSSRGVETAALADFVLPIPAATEGYGHVAQPNESSLAPAADYDAQSTSQGPRNYSRPPSVASPKRLSRTGSPSKDPRIYGGLRDAPPVIYGDESLDKSTTAPNFDSENRGRLPFSEVSNNANQQQRSAVEDSQPAKPAFARKKTSEGGTQTMVSSSDIDQMMRDRQRNNEMPIAAGAVGAAAGVAAAEAASRPVANTSSPRRSSEPPVYVDGNGQKTPARRPMSSGGNRKGAATPPPLPPDHSLKIAAVAQKDPSVTPAQPAPGLMGPPLMPASAYKNIPPRASSRTRTSSISNRSQSQNPNWRDSNASQAGGSQSTRAPSRRSSLSSFTSEIDTRFTRNGLVYPSDVEPATDPRMIQAITQTMIGEYLWKYTRKAGRSGMSSTRHRRFFWIHPYTRTLYWSEQDPSTAGKHQLKAKSVAIEAVRVITDDNHNPPGLHRKSMVVVTPGREVIFTAPTSQRHETWFNALSYLLLRTANEGEATNEGYGGEDGINAEDVQEFNPQFGRSASRTTGRGSRLSMGSYGSRATAARTGSPQRPHYTEVPTLSQRQSTAGSRTGTTPGQQYNTNSSRTEPSTPTTATRVSRSGSVSGTMQNIKHYWRPSSVRGSVSSKQSQASLANRPVDGGGAGASGGDTMRRRGSQPGSSVYDSAEDLRAVIERQEREADRLENVRACCDGKHDVGSLSHKGGRTSSMSARSGGHSHAYPSAADQAMMNSFSSRSRRGE